MNNYLDVELLRKYCAEKGMSKQDMIEFLDSSIMPFDKNFSEWLKIENENNLLFTEFIRKYDIINQKQSMAEVVNHKNNKTVTKSCPNTSRYIIDRTKMVGDNKRITVDLFTVKHSDILIAKDLYSNLSYITALFIKYQKEILLGTCRDDDNYYRYILNYYENLKESLESKYSKKLDMFDTVYKGKKLFLLKTK